MLSSDPSQALSSEVVICGCGASTPLGQTATSTAAAVRAGVTGFVHHAFMVDEVGKPMQVAQCAWIATQFDIASRIQACLSSAIVEALMPLHARHSLIGHPGLHLFIALPAARPGIEPSTADRIARGLGNTLGGSEARCAVFTGGHATGFFALHQALELLRSNAQAIAVVAGADSWLDPDTLEWLEQTGQLHGAGALNNAWGFVPGEGGGAVLLASGAFARAAGLPVLAHVRATGLGLETKLIRSGEVCLGTGLTQAIGAVLSALPSDARVSDVYCDMNGDPYRADEYGFTVTRTRERFESPSDFTAAADCWGDVGAASAPLGAVLACIAYLKDYAAGPASLLWGSSDSGERGAALLLARGALR